MSGIFSYRSLQWLSRHISCNFNSHFLRNSPGLCVYYYIIVSSLRVSNRSSATVAKTRSLSDETLRNRLIRFGLKQFRTTVTRRGASKG